MSGSASASNSRTASRLGRSAADSPEPDVSAISNLMPEVPEKLEFESFWNERGIRRFMALEFHTSDASFHVLLDDGKVPLTIKVADRSGESLRAWDLHIGAVVDVLGRPTTLMAASLRTIQWLDRNTRRLWALKMGLEERVNKFRPMPQHMLSHGVYKKLNEPTYVPGGCVNLHSIARAVCKLSAELSMYQ
jgi:hypothetical protein